MVFSLLDFFYPPKCYLCNKLLDKEPGPLCPGCWDKLPLVEEALPDATFIDCARAVVFYEGEIRQSMLRFKFGGCRHYGKWYGQLIGAMMEAKGSGDYDYVTWVPVSRRRLRRRGYDQAKVIAKEVAKYLKLPCQRTLRKIIHNKTQSTVKTAEARRANVMGAYRACSLDVIVDKRILLIDDIWTTGATMNEAARCLSMARARAVDCAVFGAKRERS